MGLFDRFKTKYQWRYYSSGFSVQVANYSTAELYATQPNLRAVVSYLADNAAQVPFKVYDRVADDDRQRVHDSPAALLLEHPNDDMTAFELKRAIYTDLLLYARSLVLIIKADTPSGWQLRHIPATWIVDYKGSWPFAPESVTIGAAGRYLEVPRDTFLLFHGYHPGDPMLASPPVEALQDTLFEQVESGRFRRQMWQRGGRFNAYIKRPKDVEPWTDEAFDRFKDTWDASWAGDNAAQGGKMPILEDGMEIAQVQFNSRDAEWSEAKRLGREDVAGVYHINPALIWPGSGQTYASAKDNARALYNEALAPVLMQVVERLNGFLLPKVGEPDSHYVEYDITIKTEGTFEEKLGALQTAAGGPILTRNEARAKLNLPALDGGDALIVPLNVLELKDALQTISEPVLAPQLKSAPVSFKAKATEEDAEELREVYRKFFRRQRNSILPKLGAEKKKGNIKADEWWNEERWNSELSDALFPVALKQSTAAAKRALASLEFEDEYDEERTEGYIRYMTDKRAQWINQKTKLELDAVDDYDDEDAEKSTYSGVFDYAEEVRSETAGVALATAVAGWAALEAVRQCGDDRKTYKTWVVTSSNPRASHAAVDGETVEYEETFSNGAQWPGDDALDAADVANCQCEIELSVR